MKARKSTIHDIAERLGVTASTVSRALGGNQRISQQTRQRVIEMARELNYQPNQQAANLRMGRTKSIGVVIPRINRQFFSNVIAGIESVTNPAGYSIIICQTHERLEDEIKSLQTLVNNRVDGIILSVSAETKNDIHIRQLLDQGIALVQFDRVTPDLPVSQVVNDNVEGARQITRHLIEQGYETIAHFAGPLHLNVYQERYQGYQQALEEAGRDLDPALVFEPVLTREQGEAQIKLLNAAGQLPRAIFAASDFSALGAIAALQALDKNIPGEVAVAGFANEPFTGLMSPGLTTVEQFSERMGNEAANLLIKELEGGGELQEKTHSVIKTEIIIRPSSHENEL